MVKILVTGGRNYSERLFLNDILKRAKYFYGSICIIEGGCNSGADFLAKYWAIENGVQYIEVPALWEYLGTSAGPIRNLFMLKVLSPNIVFAFKGGKGTEHCVTCAEKLGVEVFRTWPKDGSDLPF